MSSTLAFWHTSAVTLIDLAGERFIDFPLGYGNRSVTDRAFATAGLERQVAVEIADIAAGASYVRHGLGIALLPRFIIEPAADLRRITVAAADLRWPLSLAVPQARYLSAAVRALVSLIDEGISIR